MSLQKGSQSYTPLISFLSGKIRKNNLLELSDDQIEAISRDVVESERIGEIMSWCTDTLLLEEDVARELILMRRNVGIGFLDDQFSPVDIPKMSSVMNVSSIGPTNEDKKVNLSSSRVKGRQIAIEGGEKEKKKKKKSLGEPLRKKVPGEDGVGGIVKSVHEGTECGCFATKHSFWKNCMNCGRIFCEAEKKNDHLSKSTSVHGARMLEEKLSGEEEEGCFFCGLPPSKSVAYAIAVEEGKLSEAAQAKNMKQFKEALERRDRLLEYEKNKAKRTEIIDDQQASLFSPQDAWILPKEREEAKKNAAEEERKRKIEEMQRSRGAYTVHLDFVNRNVSLGALPNKANLANTNNETQVSDGGCGSCKEIICSSTSNFADMQKETLLKDEELMAALREKAEQQEVSILTSREGINAANRLWSSKLQNVQRNISVSSSGKGVGENEDENGAVQSTLFPENISDEEDLYAVGHFQAVAPSPSSSHQILYSIDGSKVVPQATEWTSMQERKKENGKHTASTATIVDRVSTTSPASDSLFCAEVFVTRSKRVQQDYFMEDNITFEHEWIASHRSQETGERERFHDLGKEKEEEESSSKQKEVVKTVTLEPLLPGAGNDPLLDTIPYALRMKDDGVCLSMHQPWASLLVHGIKTHEGREWPTNYRGRVWIHAASAPPVDISSVEAHYRKFLKKSDVEVSAHDVSGTDTSLCTKEEKNFPLFYPTKVLLGYVFLVDCLDRENYESAYLPEERQEESTYSFICTGATALLFPLPMMGNHKFFSLDHKVHIAAKKQLGEVDL